jgi:Ran GTPase-activating protein (RanGAP) involved in mRNA processing and transport
MLTQTPSIAPPPPPPPPRRRYGIGDKAAAALGAFLKECPLKVNSLEVEHNSIHNRGMTTLMSATAGHTMLRILDVSANEMKRSATVALTDLFLQPTPVKLVELRMSACKLGDMNMSILAKGLKTSTTIRVLKLDRNNLSMCGNDLADLLDGNTAITDLDLSWNQLRNEEATAVAKSLVGNDCLTSLNLSWNNFGYDAAIYSVAK